MNRQFLITLCLIIITMMPPGLSQADNDYIEARRLQDTGEILSLESLLKNVRPLFPGKILQIELETEEGKIVYEFEILGNDGIVREVYFDAKTGKLLSVKEED